jgi:cell division septal protein FtsQ
MFGRHQNRYERHRQARARRVQRRLEQVQRSRGTRGAPGSLRGRLRDHSGARAWAGPLALFATSLFFGTLLASSVTTTLLQWWNEKPATLQSIAVQGSERLSSEEVARATGLARDRRLEEVSGPELTRRVTAHPWIREARVAVLPTGTLIVDVTERVAQAVLRDDSGLHFIDAEGITFAVVHAADRQQAAALPLIVGKGSNPASRRAGMAIAARLAELALPGFAQADAPHRGLALQVPQPDDDREGWILSLEAGPRVILGSQDTAIVTTRLERLERLLKADLREIEASTTIDLRFAGQAVLRKTSTSKRGAPSGGSARMRDAVHDGARRRTDVPALSGARGG